LILLNFFRAEAEKAVANSQRKVIYAIEEPETSQHPNYQILLMKALLALSLQPNRQIIVTTHVPALAGLIPIEGVRFITKNEQGVPLVKLPDDNVLKEAADSLGILPESGMERARAVVLVEGKSDIIFLRHSATALKNAGHIPNSFEDLGVVPILVGGCGSIKHWVTLNLAEQLGVPWCVFLDSDIGGDPSQVRSIQKRKQEVEQSGRSFYSTRKREIENYICPTLILEECGAVVAFTDTCDAKKIIGNAMNMKPDDVIEKIWMKMSAERILQRSAFADPAGDRHEIKEVVCSILGLVA
jgi:predicted ATP-dependent endonuclease of OLD family